MEYKFHFNYEMKSLVLYKSQENMEMWNFLFAIEILLSVKSHFIF